MSKPLWKSTIVIWSEYNPHQVEIDELARDAISGEAYCSSSENHYVENPSTDPAWDGTEFFDNEEDDFVGLSLDQALRLKRYYETGSGEWIDYIGQGDVVTFTAREGTDPSENHTGPIQFIEEVDDNLWHVMFVNGLDIQAYSDELSPAGDEED